jgi:glycine cleavage system aminomethyltransferase T
VSARDEHLATRNAAGLFDFSFMGLYEFHGRAALEPRQSRRLAGIERGRLAYTLLLNDDGSVFNDATVWNMGDDRWWVFSGRPSDVRWFGGAARERSGEHAILALQGPSSGQLLARLIGADAVRELRYFHFRRYGEMLIGRLGYSGELGYELIVPRGDEAKLRAHFSDVPACSFDAANSLRIEAGYVLFEREIDGRANPAELGLERLVSDRRRVFGMSRQLVGLEIDERRAPGRLRIHVTSECDSPTLGKHIALGFANAAVRAGDFAQLDDGRFARVCSLPFYDPTRARPRAKPL